MRRCSVVAILCLLAVVGTTPALARKVEGELPVGHELVEARQALMLGDADEAIRIYREYLDAHPGDVRAFWGLAEAYTAAGRDQEDLVPLLEKRIQEQPLDVRAKQELGATYARLGDRERAHQLLMDALHQGARDAGLYA